MNFLRKIFSPSCFTISFLLLFYIFYRSEIYWNGEISNNYYLIYYIISGTLIIFSIFTFYLSEKIKDYLIISVVSVVVSLYLFEGYLTFKPQLYEKERLYEKVTGKKYDTRTRLEIYNDLIKTNSDVVVTVYPFGYVDKKSKLFPLSGMSNSKTIFCNENGYYAIYESDRYGFNNPDEEWNQQEIEYLLVGDSFTHGACVNRPDDIASVLRTLSNKSVLNLGYSGNGPLLEYATLREYLNSNVKKVLWIYYEENDLFNLNYELNNKILKSYLDDLTFTQNLKTKQNQVNELAEVEIEIGTKIETRLIKLIKLRTLRYLLKGSVIPQPQPQPEFKKILELTKNSISKNNTKLYFVYLPEINRYKSNYNNSNYLTVKKIVNELDIPFIDIHTEIFEKEQNPLKLGGVHYNVEGYRKVAEIIYKFN